MKTSNKLIALALLGGLTVFSSCKKEDDDDDKKTTVPASNRVTENISANTTWTSGKTYILGGRITVLDGVTLTIEPGVIVKGEVGIGANATALLIARGAKIMAEGTATEPIIFTTVADEIQPGQIISPNLDPSMNGLWGGVLIMGKARISASNDAGDISEVQIEGIPTSDPNGLYGGNEDDDNSGVLKYVSFRHGGTNIGAGNEINGLTLGGVGSGTVIENIEIVGTQDDGVEWFGGTVNCTNVISWNACDDGLDTDQSWAGTCDNFFVITSCDHSLELDGPEGTYFAAHVFKNGTIYTSSDEVTSSDLANLDDNTPVTLQNISWRNVKSGQKINRVTAPLVFFIDCTIDVPADSLQSHVNGAIPSGVTAGKGTGANPAPFSGWSWAHAAGMLTK